MSTADVSPWRVVSLDQYARPVAPAIKAAQKKAKRLWRRVRGTYREDRATGAECHYGDLQALPQATTNLIVANPGWQQIASELESAITALFNRASVQPIVIIGAPGSGLREILTAFGENAGHRLVKPPSIHTILGGGEAWLGEIVSTTNGDGVLIFPAIEHLYLRHYSGFDLIRALMHKLSSRGQQCIFGCQSWAWSYLCKVLPIDTYFADPFALDGFDGQALLKFFGSLVDPQIHRAITFRMADTKKMLFRGGGTGYIIQSPEETTYFDGLALRSLGIPLIAREIWRKSLGVQGPEPLDPMSLSAYIPDNELTVGVLPESALPLLQIPGEMRKCDLFILHALLLHGGLGNEGIERVLFLPRDEVEGGVNRLSNAGLVLLDDERWTVAPLAYPSVKYHLGTEGYLTDML